MKKKSKPFDAAKLMEEIILSQSAEVDDLRQRLIGGVELVLAEAPTFRLLAWAAVNDHYLKKKKADPVKRSTKASSKAVQYGPL